MSYKFREKDYRFKVEVCGGSVTDMKYHEQTNIRASTFHMVIKVLNEYEERISQLESQITELLKGDIGVQRD